MMNQWKNYEGIKEAAARLSSSDFYEESYVSIPTAGRGRTALEEVDLYLRMVTDNRFQRLGASEMVMKIRVLDSGGAVGMDGEYHRVAFFAVEGVSDQGNIAAWLAN